MLFQRKTLSLLVSGVLLAFMLQPVQAAPNPVAKPVVKPAVAKKLKPIKLGSRLALAKLLLSHRTNAYSNRYLYKNIAMADMAGTTAESGTVSHSDTNVQVKGVDEADTVKVGDDGYIYRIVNNQVSIIKGFPVAELAQTANISFPDTNFYPTGLYIQNGKLVIVGTSWQTLEQPKTEQPVVAVTDGVQEKLKVAPIMNDSKMMYGGWWWWNQYSQTRALVYDVKNHSKPELVRDVAIDGDYLDSRRIGDNVYFVARTYPHYYMYGDTANSLMMKPANMLPTIVDKQGGDTKKRLLSINDVSYFPDFVEPDYVIAASLNVANPTQPLVTKAYLGAGEMVYSSLQNLYLSASKYNFNVTDGSSDAPISNTMTTQIFKFGIADGQINFTAAGEVQGTALNQFSMDEEGDYFRIATTTYDWYSGNNEMSNSLFVLDKNMNTVGKLDNLAKGEQIYSTRFMGNRCYIVTFRLVDPLFAIDLSTPSQPVVLGELKIPGYSNYLHPYDETHLIGFGKDAEVYKSEKDNADQSWGNGSAFYQGLKMALFDVSDMTKPKELYSVTIGDRGTSSPLLWDHKALYWDAEKHLFGFPVELYKLPQAFDAKQPWQYGMTSYQGAYIYEVTPENGFKLKARLSQIPSDVKPIHETNWGYEYSYWDWQVTSLFVDRILRIDNSLYTLSNSQINAYDLTDYKLQSTLPLTTP